MDTFLIAVLKIAGTTAIVGIASVIVLGVLHLSLDVWRDFWRGY